MRTDVAGEFTVNFALALIRPSFLSLSFSLSTVTSKLLNYLSLARMQRLITGFSPRSTFIFPFRPVLLQAEFLVRASEHVSHYCRAALTHSLYFSRTSSRSISYFTPIFFPLARHFIFSLRAALRGREGRGEFAIRV